MDRDSPEPQPFDPARSDAPHLPASDGGFVLVVAASGAGDRDWAERAVTSLASGWARQGRRVLLADLSLVHPGLHRVLGVANREGVSDAFLFGSSIQKVAQPVRDRGFLFVPAGTATARPDAVTGSPRWGAVIEGCARVQATLVAFLPSDLPGGETLLDHATHVVLLTDREASGSAALQAGLGDRLRAVLVPPPPHADESDSAWNGDGAAAAATPWVTTEPASAAAPADVASQPEPMTETQAPAFETGAPAFAAEEPAVSFGAAEEPTPTAEELPPAAEMPLPTFGFEESEPAPEPAAEEPLPTFGFQESQPAAAVEEPLPTFGFEASEPAPAAEPPTPTLPVEEPAPSFAAEEPPPSLPVEEPAPSFAVEEPTLAEEPAPSFTVEEPAASLASSEAPSRTDDVESFTASESEPSFSIAEAAAAPSEPPSAQPPASAEPAPAFDVGSFGEIEVAEPAPAAQVLSGFDDIALPAATEPPPAQGMDLDLGALPEGGTHIEEVPSFSGELAFLEPEAQPERAAEPAPVMGSSWAAPTGAPAGMAPSAGSDLRAADIPMREPDPARERPRPSSGRPGSGARPEPKPEPAKSQVGAWALLVLVVLAGVVGAAWYGLVDVPWLSDQLAAFSPSAAAPAQASPAGNGAPAVEESRGYAYSLTIESFPDPAVARIQAGSLNEQRPDLLFVVAPVQVNGRVLHRLLAGPAADSAGAEALRTTLATVLTRERPASWVIRRTTLAFNMGDREDLASAAERVAELSRVDIPSYVLELPGRSASGARVPRYRVYSGAYADEQEAIYLRNVLVAKGFPDARLVQRIGRHPQ